MTDLFVPKLSLTKEAHGKYTLHATTLVPSTCYSAGRAVRGAPPSVRLLNTVEPVLLNLHVHGGLCAMHVHTVKHQLHHLTFGPEKIMVDAFVMHGLQVLGQSSILIDRALPGPDPTPTSDWTAWVDEMPPGPSSLHVHGRVTVPTPGYEATLSPTVPQGINPKILMLDLKVARKPGIWPQHVAQINASYVQQPYEGHYEQVQIMLPQGGSITLNVETAV
jgi:hypothetical protein